MNLILFFAWCLAFDKTMKKVFNNQLEIKEKLNEVERKLKSADVETNDTQLDYSKLLQKIKPLSIQIIDKCRNQRLKICSPLIKFNCIIWNI